MHELLKALQDIQLRDLPWRHTHDPYKILVSEIMLQQTQVDRVVPFYTRFIRQFPTPQKLATAPLSKVLKAWQGLGYNRRAVYLQRSAKILSETKTFSFADAHRSGEMNTTPTPPRRASASQGTSVKLSGVGPYTEAAVEAFAYNKPTVFIETNIRTVFFYHCFPNKKHVSDKEILPLVEQALKKSKMEPREFYARLMDYGTMLKKQGVKLNSQSKHYSKQSKFEGSYRQVRGQILRALLVEPATLNQLIKITSRKKSELVKVVAVLSKEGMIELKRNKFYIAG
ncbi:MAG: A/G-specific adenine glycosylase [Candidatus Pacebacteria bacterium]|nr:A/G-specific adenine glycosylase [Candidatus Paceibacterota bacterium]